MLERLLISVQPDEIRSAVVVDGRLSEFSLERTDSASLVGNVYLARVTSLAREIEAAFLDCGLARAGFLSAREAPGAQGPISGRVREGGALLVQAIRDPSGDKGAKLTARPALAGRLLVLCPGRPGLSLSRRIGDRAERARLARALEGPARGLEAGIVVRTAAVGADADALAADLAYLREAWRRIEQARARARAPALLHRESGPLERVLRDRMGAATEEVVLDEREAFAAAKAFCERAVAGAGATLTLHAAPEPLFRAHGIEAEIDSLSEPRVGLPSGGALVIEPTRALTAIDVDSAAFAGGAGRDAALATNLEAAVESARQLRLRNIGGLVVIDFIGMADAADRTRVQRALVHAVAADALGVRVAPMSEFGVVELTRKRVRESLAEALSEPCAHCRGEGRIKRAREVASEILRAGLAEARAQPGRALSIRAAPEVVALLGDEGAGVVRALGRAAAARVELVADEGRVRDSFEVASG
jgi:ribonuclease G